MSYVDLAASDGDAAAQQVLPIAQLSSPGAVASPELLPSFLYLPHEGELAAGDLSLPWTASRDYAVGEMARSRGAGTPIRLVSSAKSWLCHPGVDRRAAILPNDAPPEVARVSPLEASVRYLNHLREAWDHAHPDAPFAAQDVTVTIPASFDPAARELTAEAAQAAGYTRMTLLEEPQAALYSWIQKSGGGWRKDVKVGDIILVVDVGGGTTDLSLIAVVEREGNLELHRVAVGEHILLGGDNMDLALAHVVARKLAAQGTQADPWQLRALTYACRGAKETLLSDRSVETVPLVVPSRGSKLIGGSIRTELTRAELTQILLEGFFPQVEASERPAVRTRAGLTQLGLPYAQDAGITRHLAAFLGKQVGALAELDGLPAAAHHPGASFLHPTAVLFNGGVFKSELLTERILAILNGWLAADGAAPARLLGGADLDLAVARGAAYYGYVKRGRGVRIRGGTARAYYVAIESAMPAIPGMEPPISALCVAPFGMEEGSDAALPEQEFGLVVGEPVQFRFFGSSVRRQDQVGDMLDYWSPEELQELEAIQATLPADGRTPGEVVAVRLHARVTEAGTLELEAVPRGSEARWKVEFDVRGGVDA
nr:Hsp70 family protein [Burkholderia sp. Cy-637]